MKRRWLALWAALFAILLFVGWKWNNADRLLEPLSKRICPWPERAAGVDIWRYSWLSETDLLEVTSPASMRGLAHVARFDTVRKRSVALPSFQATLLREGRGTWPTLSPDGKWAVCWVVVMGQPRVEWLCAVSIDGAHVIRWPKVPGGIVDYLGHGWMPGGKSYIIIFADRIVEFRIHEPGRSRRFAIPKLDPDLRVIGILPDGPLLAGSTRHRQGQPVVLTHVRVTGDSASVQTLRFDLPAGAESKDVRVSEQGDRLVWQLAFQEEKRPNAWRQWLRRLTGMGNHARQGIWVSRLDGTGFREIGHVHDSDLTLRQWLPGGHKVAFVRGQQLYTVPVDE